MSKLTSYIVAVLACAVYLILFSTVVAYNFKQLGTIWYILFLGMPIIGIWKVITGLGKKGKDNKKDDTENTPEQEN